MARDAQLAGDRVQTEYYLQFADHYFRILGESRARFEEQRRQRGDGDEDDGDDDQLDALDDDRGSYSHAGQFDRDDEGDQVEEPPRRQDPAPRSQDLAPRRHEQSPRRPEQAPRAERDHAPRAERGQERVGRPPERDVERASATDSGRQRQRDESAERISLEVIPPSIGGDRPETMDGNAGEEAPRPRRRTRRPRNDQGDEEIAPAA